MPERIFSALISLIFPLIGLAGVPTATLQSGDKLTPFLGENALIEAYKAAVDGDVITLSAGNFTTVDNDIEIDIDKEITIIGVYAFSSDASKATIIRTPVTVSADNVTLEGLRFYMNYPDKLTIKGADNLTIQSSYLYYIVDIENGEKKYHDNTIITDCELIFFEAMSLSKNLALRNCRISHFWDINETEYPALIENCNISGFSDTQFTSFKQPFAIYRNCLLGLYKDDKSTSSPTLQLTAPSQFHNVIFYQYFKASEGSSYSIS